MADTKISALTEKTTLCLADVLTVLDSEASNTNKKAQAGKIPLLRAVYTVGDGGAGETIDQAVAAIGGSQRLLVTPPGSYAGGTIPTNISLYMAPGALNTGTLTINGQLIAGDYNILNGGTIVFGASTKQSVVNPKWWGAVGDDTDADGGGTDDYDALAAMLTSIGSVPMTVHFTNGTYMIGTDFTFPANVRITREKAAYLAPYMVLLTATITNADSGSVATVWDPDGGLGTAYGPCVTALPTGWEPCRSYITYGGERKRVGVWTGYSYITNSGYTLLGKFTNPFSNTVTLSSRTVSLVGSSETLERGDIIWQAGTTMHRVENINATPATSITVVKHPAAVFTEVAAYRGVRVKIVGPLDIGARSQFFKGKGVVRIEMNSVDEVYPEWWGAKADRDNNSATANSLAFDHAIWAGFANDSAKYDRGWWPSVVRLSNGEYRLGETWFVREGSIIKGAGNSDVYNGTRLTLATGTPIEEPPIVVFPNGNSSISGAGLLQDFMVVGTSKNWPVPGIVVNATLTKLVQVGAFGFHWSIYFSGGNQDTVNNCTVQGIHGIYGGTDGFIIGNNLSIGSQRVNYSTFSGNGTAVGSWYTSSGYITAGTPQDGWNIDTANHKVTHTSGTDPLKQTIVGTSATSVFRRIMKGQFYGFHITMSTGVTGSVSWSLGGVTGSLSEGVNYNLVQALNSGDLILTPSNDFDGSLSACYITDGVGLQVTESGNNYQGNIVFGDSGAVAGTIHNATCNGHYNNRYDNIDVGYLHLYKSTHLCNNRFWTIRRWGMYFYGDVYRSVISGNEIPGAGDNTSYGVGLGKGVAFSGSCKASLTSIKNNNIGNVIGGHMISPVDIPSTVTYVGSTYAEDFLLCEDNNGVDTGNDFLAMTGATPAVLAGKKWKTGNSGATTMTSLVGACRGKEIFILFGDDVTTVDFSGSDLYGNGGLDWLAGTGDSMKVVCDEDYNFQCTLTKLPKTVAITGASRAIAAGECTGDYTFTNTGASGTIVFTLPAAVPGMMVRITRVASYAVQIDPNGTEIIGDGGAGKYLSLDSDNCEVTLVAVTGKWWPVDNGGTTSYET